MDQINWVLVFLVCNFGLSLFNSISNRHKVAQDDLDAHKSKIEKEVCELWTELNHQAREISSIRPVVDSKPTHDDLGKVYEEIRNVSKAVSDLSSNMGNMTGTLSAVSKQLDRMDTFWRDHGSK